jgi:hypothetical protein
MFLLDVTPYLLLAGLTMLATYMLTTSIGNIYILLLSRIAIAALLYVGTAFLMRSSELREIINFLLKRKIEG